MLLGVLNHLAMMHALCDSDAVLMTTFLCLQHAVSMYNMCHTQPCHLQVTAGTFRASSAWLLPCALPCKLLTQLMHTRHSMLSRHGMLSRLSRHSMLSRPSTHHSRCRQSMTSCSALSSMASTCSSWSGQQSSHPAHLLQPESMPGKPCVACAMPIAALQHIS